MSDKFSLTSQFLDKYKTRDPGFGFNGLGELVYKRTYSRIKPDGKNEEWWETVKRVVEGTFEMQRKWIEGRRLGWNPWKAQKSAQEMYDRIFTMKFLPPGRGLWAMGTKITEERHLYAALNNCSFVSTENMGEEEVAKPFEFLMDMSMLGVGVGFDTKGAGKLIVKGFRAGDRISFSVNDDREGWVKSTALLITNGIKGGPDYSFDYTQIRPAGQPIKTFGGISPGYEVLERLHNSIRAVIKANEGLPITSRTIVDIMNFIGKAVVSGNVRRSAEIAFGEPTDLEFTNLKNYVQNPERAEYGWVSNNSIFVKIGADYSQFISNIVKNGEPGFMWLENARQFGRMGHKRDYKDHRAAGANPCAEQTLESYELCCLVETFPARHESLEDYLTTLKYAYLYAKTVTLGETHWPETNRVMLRNRRIGCSMSGIAQFVNKFGLEELRFWSEEGYATIQKYDEIYSDWLAIPKSIKVTSIKPSGTVSLLAGATPGIHFPESRYYIRRMRLGANSDLVAPLKEAGYDLEPAIGSDGETLVVSIPVALEEGIKTLNDVSIWEQAMMAVSMQEWWSDNQVSCTISFDPKTEANQIEPVLNFLQYRLKSISFLPRIPTGSYPQMPYEAITKETYDLMSSNLRPLHLTLVEDRVVEKGCDGDVCQI